MSKRKHKKHGQAPEEVVNATSDSAIQTEESSEASVVETEASVSNEASVSEPSVAEETDSEVTASEVTTSEETPSEETVPEETASKETVPTTPASDQGMSGNLVEPPKRSAGLKFSIFIQQAINVFAIIAFVGSALYLGKIVFSYVQSSIEYNRLNREIVSVVTTTPVPTEVPTEPTKPNEASDPTEVAVTTTPTPTPLPPEHEEYGYAQLAIDFEALSKKTDECVGWIDIPGCGISYPLMYSTDNDYYLRHTYTGLYNVSGSIFLDSNMSPNFDDQPNSLIYGHNQNNGKMFSNLHMLEDEAFASEKYNQLIAIYFKDEVRYYTIFSVRVRPKTDGAYFMSYKTDEQYQNYINNALEQSEWDFHRKVTYEDQTITLVTCMDNTDYRLVVNAVRID